MKHLGLTDFECVLQFVGASTLFVPVVFPASMGAVVVYSFDKE